MSNPNIDKLIKYIEYRIKKYGAATIQYAQTSNYYNFIGGIVRVSDHLKYSLDSQKTFDYSFIIQDNNQYIFSISAKSTTSNKLYLKIVTLDEAKKFIRSLHDLSIPLQALTEVYHPEGWNNHPIKNKVNITGNNKLEWNIFVNNYLNKLDVNKKRNILDWIEQMLYGQSTSGDYETKLKKVEELYNKLTDSQYKEIIRKLKGKGWV